MVGRSNFDMTISHGRRRVKRELLRWDADALALHRPTPQVLFGFRLVGGLDKRHMCLISLSTFRRYQGSSSQSLRQAARYREGDLGLR